MMSVPVTVSRMDLEGIQRVARVIGFPFTSDRFGAAWSLLAPRHRLVLDLRFGLSSGRPMTLREIGDVMDLTRARIGQLQYRGLCQLNRWIRVRSEYLFRRLRMVADRTKAA